MLQIPLILKAVCNTLRPNEMNVLNDFPCSNAKAVIDTQPSLPAVARQCATTAPRLRRFSKAFLSVLPFFQEMEGSEAHADAEEGEVVDDGVGGVEAAEGGGQLEGRAAVVGAAGQEAELPGGVADVYVEGDE